MLIRRFFCVAIIALGSGLEIYFYIFRFIGDGMILPAAIGAAVALELLLAFAVYNSHVSRWFVAVAVIVSLYATVQTSAGQTFSLLSHNIVNDDTDKLLITEHENNLKRLALEADAINNQLKQVEKIEDRANFGRTIYGATLRLEKINAERMESLKIISSLATTEKTKRKEDLKSMSVYDFYSSMPSWTGMDWLKFVFHSFLSVLITLMTPIGILSWNRKDEIVRIKKMKLTRPQIEKFVNFAWYKVRNKTGRNILEEVSYNDLMSRNGETITLGIYPELIKRCKELNLIDDNKTILISNESEAVNKLIEGAK